MEHLLPILLVCILLAFPHVSHADMPNQIHLLRSKSGKASHHVVSMSCESWRLAVETNNIIGWGTIPVQCENYIGHYMLGDQYLRDFKAVCDVAAKYAENLNLTGDGKDLWVFDIDETSLSNLPYYAENGFGALEYNDTSFNEWALMSKATALPDTLKLYQKLLTLCVKIVFITGRTEKQRNATATNLKNVGYKTWKKLILRSTSESGLRAVVYKSLERKKLEKQGYRIIGNIGDQWSDITGTHVGDRTFKLPDPMYYIS